MSEKAKSPSENGIQKRSASDGAVSYRAQIRIRGFAPVSKTFRRRTDAKKWVEDTKAAMRAGSFVSSEADRTTLKEALERYLREGPPKKKNGAPLKGWDRQQDRVKVWMKHDLAARFLSQLRGADFSAYRDQRLGEGKAMSTVRSELALISSVFKVARTEWRMETLRNPIASVAVPNPGETNARNRRLELDEQKRLLAGLEAAGPYYAPMAELAIETAMRQGELLALTWSSVDLQKRVAKLSNTKNSEPRDVPLSTRACEIIRALPRPIDNEAPLFPLRQDDVIRTFRQVCTDEKIDNLKFHDLRHEAASRLAPIFQAHELAKIGGWKTLQMVMRYYKPNAEALARKLA